jgi:hypothetical protein
MATMTPTTTGTTVRADYILKRGDVDDAAPGAWYLQRGPDSDAECVQVFSDLGSCSDYRVQIDAQAALRGLGLRLVRWETLGDKTYRAITAPMGSGWFVTVYRGRGGLLWRRGRDGEWFGPGSARYSSHTALERAQGPLVVHEVHGLNGLVEELLIMQALTVYCIGDEECHERDCDGYDADGNVIDADGVVYPDREFCFHVEEKVATSQDAVALRRVHDQLCDLEGRATVDAEQAHHYSHADLNRNEGILHAVTAIREAIQTDGD